MTQIPKTNSTTGCIVGGGLLALFVCGFPISIWLRHSIIPTNTLTVTVFDATGRTVPDAKLRFSRHTNLLLAPIMFAEGTSLVGTTDVTTDIGATTLAPHLITLS
jgi:hypothetical protein